MQNVDSAEKLMKRAIRLAKKGCGRTSPNPMVGAVIFNKGDIVGEGYHKRAGEAHGEINAIRAAGERSRGADLYINLEPCSHFGKTPPCADAVIDAGIKRVFIAMKDPNPKVAGEGIRRLKEAGVEVNVGILEREAVRLNEAFIKHVTTGMPFVTLKAAATLDGKIATRTGDSKWITGEASRRHVHRMRDSIDAILVGIRTVERDDPSLTTRLGKRQGKDPIRVILDEELRISPSARVICGNSEAELIIATTERAPEDRIKKLEEAGAKVLIFDSSSGLIPFRQLMKSLGKMDINSVLIEGGSEVHASALREGIIDKVALFYAPKILGGVNSIGVVGGKGAKHLSDAIMVEGLTTRHMGEDILVEGYIKGR